MTYKEELENDANFKREFITPDLTRTVHDLVGLKHEGTLNGSIQEYSTATLAAITVKALTMGEREIADSCVRELEERAEIFGFTPNDANFKLVKMTKEICDGKRMPDDKEFQQAVEGHHKVFELMFRPIRPFQPEQSKDNPEL